MSRNGNRAGKRHERRVVAWFRDHGYEAQRDRAQLEHDGRGGGIDVDAWVGDVHLVIQCRDQKRVNLWAALGDAQAGAVAGEIPLAFARRVVEAWPEPAQDVVIIGVEDWFTLLELIRSGSGATRGNGAVSERAAPTFFLRRTDD
ncbi:MAG TPA: hypothetical protein VK531_12045 [Gemmatimonadales bacterium]|nr:hypothetical protein [Gemmatimonadales bacterium]